MTESQLGMGVAQGAIASMKNMEEPRQAVFYADVFQGGVHDLLHLLGLAGAHGALRGHSVQSRVRSKDSLLEHAKPIDLWGSYYSLLPSMYFDRFTPKLLSLAS